MPGQKQISAFFKPIGVSKRASLTTENGHRSKRSKSGGEERVEENGPTCSSKDIEMKHLTAKLKLRCRATQILPSDIGLSWFSALESEFSKEYFTKASHVYYHYLM